MPAKPRTQVPELGALNGMAANLRAVAGDDMMTEALVIVRERLGLTAEKLALILIRSLNPDELIGQAEETELRGVGKRDTLTEYKKQGLLPHFLNGCQPEKK